MTNQVLEIIKNRHHAGTKPGKRNDPYKVGLCIEGGGLRGVVSGGALAALEALGYKNSFDTVYGCSCGSYCGSYFASGDTLTGARFFLDYSQKQFISIKRFLRGGSIFDLDYVERVMHSFTPLKYKAAISSQPPLHIVTTDVEHGRPVTLKKYSSAYELDRALKASATIPSTKKIKPILYKGRQFVDGSILDPFCLHSAIEEECTHIVIIFSMPWQHRHTLKLVDEKLIAPYFSKINTHLAELYLNHGKYSVNGLSHIWNHYDGTHILTIAPGKNRKLPGQLTRDRKRLGFGFLAGAESVLKHLAPDDKTKDLILESFRNDLSIH